MEVVFFIITVVNDVQFSNVLFGILVAVISTVVIMVLSLGKTLFPV